MAKKIFSVLVGSIGLMIIVSTLHCQSAKIITLPTGAKNTVTLPKGEVVWVLNGDWEGKVEYNLYQKYSSFPFVWKITQEGRSFTAVRMSGPGQDGVILGKAAEGELEKSGIKKVTIFEREGINVGTGDISDDGNKIMIDYSFTET